MKQVNVKFVNKVIKQGNSLCVRIPFKVAKKLDVGENSVVCIDMVNMHTVAPMHPSLLEAYQKIPALKKYSLNEIMKYVLAMNVEKASGKRTNKNSEYQKFKKIVLKNKKQIKRNLHASETWKNQMKMLKEMEKH
jgi:antitoxin component of MazEF toxin-antitoxin module